ncbi:IS1634 family transposase [Methanosarcinales archaeon]|nr:MAG: IS1634 family transposase [Methanosarcinales archaeon]
MSGLTGGDFSCKLLNMFIRAVEHKDKKNRKKYRTYKLVESVRTERGPRQITVLNLGADFKLPKEHWKELANCIEEIITEQQTIFEYPKKIRTLAEQYARRIIQKQASVIDEEKQSPPDYARVDLNSINNEQPRTAGAEHVVYETIKLLGIDKKLEELGLKPVDIAAIIGVLCGRMIVPGSERSTHYWLQHISGLGELIDFDFSLVTLDRLYKASDHLLKHKEEIEAHLRKVEIGMFGLEERIMLYDLTNTFFEGTGKYNAKARYGRSKEKRNDCPLVTLGLVLDSQGFPKRSRIFEGNVSEPRTLETMIRGLSDEDDSQKSLLRPTIVMDAGIASEDNVKWLKEHNYRYIVVSRKKKVEIPPDIKMVPVKQDEKTKTVLVQAGLVFNKETDEMELYCHSVDKEKKEESIKNKFQERFEAELLKADKALHLKNGTKRYDKVIEKIGRLKEKFKRVSHLYKITIQKDDDSGKATKITWERKKEKKASGVYCLRTNQKNLNEKEIWDIYTMLTDIEDAFRCMKSELGLRPNYHHLERRSDGHIFITLIAYHIMQTIRIKLREKGIRFCWNTIRVQLSSHMRISTTVKREDGKVIHIRKSSRPEPNHKEIYDALGFPSQVGKTLKAIM